MKKTGYAILLMIGMIFCADAQEILNKPIVPDHYVMFKKILWRRMNLTERQNRPFFSKNAEITRLLFEAVEKGLIKAYRSDSCLNPMTDEEWELQTSVLKKIDRLEDPEDPFSAIVQIDSAVKIPGEAFSVVEIQEDMIFDRNRSRVYYYIQSLGATIPKTRTTTDLYDIRFDGQKKVYFKYEEAIELFRTTFADRAIWYNDQNKAMSMNLSDAFELRMFRAPIVKVSNNENVTLRKKHEREIGNDPLKAVVIQQQYEYDLMERESELWEY